MNRLERTLHQSLEGRPRLRNSLKFFYQAALSSLPFRKPVEAIAQEAGTIWRGGGDGHVEAGYLSAGRIENLGAMRSITPIVKNRKVFISEPLKH